MAVFANLFFLRLQKIKSCQSSPFKTTSNSPSKIRFDLRFLSEERGNSVNTILQISNHLEGQVPQGQSLFFVIIIVHRGAFYFPSIAFSLHMERCKNSCQT